MKFANKFSLNNKIIIITGGSGFLGKQFATTIANNLKHLDYEKVLAVSRLTDIPNRVLSILAD